MTKIPRRKTENPTGKETRPTISALYPEITRVMLFIAFEEADSESEPNYQQIIFTGHDEATFRLDCSREECVGGGFDLAPVIDEMVKSGESRIHGVRTCAGTLGAGGRCDLKAEYRIIID